MSVTSDSQSARTTWRDTFAVYLQPRVLIVLFLGFSAGLPLALSSSTLQLWLREYGIDLGTIGLLTLVGTPYSFKFLWAPVVDAYDAPVLSRLLGRRRGWLVLSQLLLMGAIALLAISNPRSSSIIVVAGAALLVAAASATQDILIDAFRVESLTEREQAAGMASYVAAYRIGMLVSTAGALYVVSGFELWGAGKDAAWALGYLVMAGLVAIGLVTTLLATEPEKSKLSETDWLAHRVEIKDLRFGPAWLLPFCVKLESWVNAVLRTRVGTAAYAAFSDFLARDMAIAVLVFVVLYKFCDAFAGAMTAAFVIDLGFTRTDYANIVKGVGLAATLIGGFAGGFVARAYPLATALWIGAVLQMASNFVFSWQAHMGMNYGALIATIIAENFAGAIGTVIFVAYLSALCQSPLHTATQYALLTALAATGRNFLSAVSGFVAESTGWALFFAISALTAIPSLLLLWWLQVRGHFNKLGPVKVTGGDD